MPITLDSFHDPVTGTVTHLVADVATGHAAVIDPVLDFDLRSGRTATRSARPVVDAVRARGLSLEWILETHVHADHVSSARFLQRELGGRVAVGAQICQVQQAFKRLFNLEPGFATDGSQFDRLLQDGETLALGDSTVTAIWVPGHTPADMAYAVDDLVFVGDTLFMPDVGSARADFPGGDARQLWRSIRRLLSLPPATRLLVCHDYPPPGRAVAWETTVGEQRSDNIHVHDGIDETLFVRMRETRDDTLDVPALILPSIQINVRGGSLPPPESDGVSYLKVPVDAFPPPRR